MKTLSFLLLLSLLIDNGFSFAPSCPKVRPQQRPRSSFARQHRSVFLSSSTSTPTLAAAATSPLFVKQQKRRSLSKRQKLARWIAPAFFGAIALLSPILPQNTQPAHAAPTPVIVMTSRTQFASASAHPEPTVAQQASHSGRIRISTASGVVLGTAAVGVGKTKLRRQQEQEDEELVVEMAPDSSLQKNNVTLTTTNSTNASFRLPKATATTKDTFKNTRKEAVSKDDPEETLREPQSRGPVQLKESQASFDFASSAKEKIVKSFPASVKISETPPTTTTTKTASTTTTTDSTVITPFYANPLKARQQQPKSPAEEAKLQARYAAIESLEERAFQILVDLGMVEVTVPDSSSSTIVDEGEWQ